MKAFFSSLTRRGSENDETVGVAGEASTSYKSSLALHRPKQTRADTQTSFRSNDTSARDIGYMPPSRASPSQQSSVESHAPESHPGRWSSKVSQGLKSSVSLKKKDKNGIRNVVPDGSIKSREYACGDARSSPVEALPLISPETRSGKRSLSRQEYPPSASRSVQQSFRDNASANRMISRTAVGLDNKAGKEATSSSELANKLNELAVANADGLLDDDEYRALRSAVFDRTMRFNGVSEADKAQIPLFRNTASKAEPRSSWEYLEQTSEQDEAHSFPSAVNGKSRYARRSSIAALSTYRPFSRESRATGNDSCPPALNRRDSLGAASSLVSNREDAVHRPVSTRSYQSSKAVSSQASHFGRLRSASQYQRAAQADMAAKDMERAFSEERTARSLRAVSIYDASAPTDTDADTNLPLARGSHAMFGAEYARRSTAEIRAELAVVKKEGECMLETFALMEENLLLKHDRPLTSSGHRRDALQSVDMNASATEAVALEQELNDMHEKKQAVVKRYENRLSFLQSKLRSAAIREGLN